VPLFKQSVKQGRGKDASEEIETQQSASSVPLGLAESDSYN
jgi:hypothetical protein